MTSSDVSTLLWVLWGIWGISVIGAVWMEWSARSMHGLLHVPTSGDGPPSVWSSVGRATRLTAWALCIASLGYLGALTAQWMR